MRKAVVRMKRVKVLHGNCVRFDPVDPTHKKALNGMYVNVDQMPEIEHAQEIEVTLEVVK